MHTFGIVKIFSPYLENEKKIFKNFNGVEIHEKRLLRGKIVAQIGAS